MLTLTIENSMDQFEKVETTKNEWKYIEGWRSQSWPREWSYRYHIKQGKRSCQEHWNIQWLSTTYGNLFDCPKRDKKTKTCLQILSLERFFFSEINFCLIISHFFNPILKMFYNLSVQHNMADHFFWVFGPETKEKIN